MNTSIYMSVDFVLGGVFILFYAGQRFNTPITNRSSTTAGRYFASLFCYCVVAISLYFTLVKFPHLLAFLLEGNKDAVPGWAMEISSPLVMALLLTVLLPKVPFLSTIDQWVCRQLQNMAAIPWEIRRLSAELRGDELVISSDEQVEIRRLLQDDGFDLKDIVFESANSPASAWCQLTALLHKVNAWESDRRMAGYLASSNTEMDRLRLRHQSLFAKAKTCFHLLNEDQTGATTKTHEAVVRYREDFLEQVGQLRLDTLDFIARGVLYADLTDRARENRLNALGFSIDWPGPVFTLNQMMLLFAVLCVVTLSGFVLFSDTVRGLSFGVMLTRAIMISVIYSVAVACAVLPKATWSLAKVRVGDIRPIAFYLTAGLMAAGITFITSVGFNSILMRNLGCGFHRTQHTYPWVLISFATALTTAVMVDNPRFSTISTLQQRCLEGASQGAVMFGVAYVTYRWLLQLSVSAIPINCDLKIQVPQRLTMMVMAGVVGFVIGFFIPTWYRRHQEALQEERSGKLPEPLSVARQAKPTVISV